MQHLLTHACDMPNKSRLRLLTAYASARTIFPKASLSYPDACRDLCGETKRGRFA